jgi:hypothetical protein
MMRQDVLDKLRTAKPEDMGRDVIEFFGLKPGDRLDWNADTLNIGGDSIEMADVIQSVNEAESAQGVRIVNIFDIE